MASPEEKLKIPPASQELTPTVSPSKQYVNPTESLYVGKARVTIIDSVYHQCDIGEPVIFDNRYGKFLKSHEQPYNRIIEVTEEWQKLDTGWLKSCSYLIIKNESGHFHKIPTDAEKQKVREEKVIEASLVPHSFSPCACLHIFPQESLRIVPVELSRIKVRCRKGNALIRYLVIPE